MQPASRSSASNCLNPKPQLLHLLNIYNAPPIKDPFRLHHLVCNASPLHILSRNNLLRRPSFTISTSLLALWLLLIAFTGIILLCRVYVQGGLLLALFGEGEGQDLEFRECAGELVFDRRGRVGGAAWWEVGFVESGVFCG